MRGDSQLFPPVFPPLGVCQKNLAENRVVGGLSMSALRILSYIHTAVYSIAARLSYI